MAETDGFDLGADDPSLGKRPRDARLIHLLLAQYGCSSYQERVPLQLMDFAYRYTLSILQDALHFTVEGYATSGRGITAPSVPEGNATVVGPQAVRLAIHSRTHYQYAPALPKEVLMGLAQSRNDIALPPVSSQAGSLQLPPEQFLLTAQGWTLAEDVTTVSDVNMPDHSEEETEEVEGGVMEDVFGRDSL